MNHIAALFHGTPAWVWVEVEWRDGLPFRRNGLGLLLLNEWANRAASPIDASIQNEALILGSGVRLCKTVIHLQGKTIRRILRLDENLFVDFLFWDILSQHVPNHHVTAWEVRFWRTVNHPCRAARGHEDGDQHGLCSLDARARDLHKGGRDGVGVLALVAANRVEVSPNENLLLGLLG